MNLDILAWEEIISEGTAKIIIPKRELFKRPDGTYEPAWSPVFYNPIMRVNRDIASLATFSYFEGREYYFVEPLGGTGVRGLRLALESNGTGIINDVDPISYYYIRRNIVLNKVMDKVFPSLHEANGLLNNLTFSGLPIDYIDVDPYGSPIPFIDSAIKPLGKESLIGITATDTGPLNCSHKNKALRRYGVRCIKTDFSRELGLRILLYNIVFRAASLDVALYPLISYSHKHYYRVIFQAERTGRKSYEVIDKCRGYLWYCRSTMERGFIKEPVENIVCSNGDEPEYIGPLWICGLGNKIFLQKMISNIDNMPFLSKETIELLNKIEPDITINKPYIRYDKLFGLHRKNQPPINDFIEKIRELGYLAYRTHFDPRGIRTNADIKDLHRLISS
ncbi:tRNA (guanine(26)-N(2))-dimethyltransferase [Staphylothermus hellenicus]|uniref:tRNA (guanine(26)-N(2))-dimethyltransferase n=1 Tax=Staphylothermus hellenicus (strain DSM 12710 / JCM 10830 / BK20S6-10-b1 / P8) TaxID=591019 RepID=D7D955_STAHD|nr:tRNA (guanine(26)-N(2))-dimethyltransferase [Staphylothermus hellenicus]ADI32301.1 tRNA (guanine-N(2)-)-methyltransferase [Staphylothermus hellenicus DSM 12710]